MRAIVLGFGLSGEPVVKFLIKQGYEVYVHDEQKVCGLKRTVFFKNHTDIDVEVDFIVVSSGIKKTHPLCARALKRGVKVLSEAEFAFQYIKNKCIGITGSNGKTTTASLCEHVLKQKYKVKVLGNIGRSLTSYLLEENKDEILIVEFSSFQLQYFKQKVLDIAAILNITPDHIDWHGSFEAYLLAKLNIVNCLKTDDLFVSKEIFKKYFNFFKKVYVFDNFLDFKDDNVLCAYTICKKLKISDGEFINSYKEFKKLPHRLEYVKKINDISFYNDSKATNPFSVIHAVNTLKKNLILIAGGEDKGLSYKNWQKTFEGRVKCVFLIGSCAKKMKEELTDCNIVILHDLETAVKQAYKIASKNDCILLSPGCSSFDQFQNYEHRGNEFKKIVENLEVNQ